MRRILELQRLARGPSRSWQKQGLPNFPAEAKTEGEWETIRPLFLLIC